MSEHEIESLPPDVLALLESAKPIVPLAPDQKAAILASVESRVGPGGGGGGGGSGGAASPASKLVTLAVTFALGVGAGIGIDRAFAPPPAVSAPVVERRADPPAPSAVPSAVASSDAVPATSLPDAPRPRASAAHAEPTPSRGLAAERALLDVARNALARGEASEALAATSRHAREYPDGALVEEREAMAVKALAALGRTDEARARARDFERRFPNGLMLRAVRSAVGEEP